MIEQLLNEIVEDKHQNLSTTSKQFKTDLWNFCIENPMILLSDAVEYGTHKGQTTRILSHLFRRVYTCNLPGNFDKAKALNSDRKNIEYVGIDLYQEHTHDKLITDTQVSLFFVDAVHTHDAVFTDVTRSCLHSLAPSVYFVFDDYGLAPEVKKAVDDLMWVNKLEFVKHIGHDTGHDFGQGRVLKAPEGIICKLKQ